MKFEIPWTYEEEKVPRFHDLGVRSWRWVFEIFSWGINVNREWRPHTYKPGCQWAGTHCGVSVSFLCRWDVSQSHFYYDGAHCIYNLGFFSVYIAGLDCDKCFHDLEGHS